MRPGGCKEGENTDIAVGNESFEDCPMLTWSFGCTGAFDPTVPPSS